MKKIFFLKLTLTIFVLTVFFSSCTKDEPNVDPNPNGEFGLGLTGKDDFSKMPSSTNFGFKGGNLPASADITSKFPPIGDQGQYGTCVAWAVGYNMKTAISGIKNSLNASQLADSRNQFSPKYLFTSIPDDQKNADCNGTSFEPALQSIQDNGIATMQTVPYAALNGCNKANLETGWTTEASKYKIKYWRKVEGNMQSIKENIANNIPVVFGAELGENFMTWKGDGVLSSSTFKDPNAQHGRHAMVIAGYDDNKGPNGAFKVVNSWSNNWGNSGTIWIDYKFFLAEFVMKSGNDYTLFIAEDAAGKDTPPDPKPDPNKTGVDLAPWIFADYSTYPNSQYYNERQINFNVYNIGQQTASAASDWSYYYIYYNAYDADDYGVIFYDEFNTSVAQNTYSCPTEYNCIFNYNIPAGNSFTNVVFGQQNQTRTYYMPEITGDYYLAMIVDAGDKFTEQDEMNNIFYSTLDPKYFEAGYSNLKSGGSNGQYFKFTNSLPNTTANIQKSEFNSAVTKRNRNAYSPQEIKAFFAQEKASGRLQAKAREYVKIKNTSVSK